MISQTSEYALRAVVFLASRRDRSFTAREIAEGTKVPAGYLAKILQSLAKAGLVQSQRGLGGGFVLARAPADISVLGVLRATDSALQRITACPLGLRTHTKLCALHQKLDAAAALLEEYFSGTTIEDLVSEPRKIRPLCEVSEAVSLSVSATGGAGVGGKPRGGGAAA